jgi:hypothetical protein
MEYPNYLKTRKKKTVSQLSEIYHHHLKSNHQVFSSSPVKGIPEASLVLAVHFWI